jgi:DNA-binding transcriptional MerR regulator
MNDNYTIGKISKISGVSTRTIRFYCDIGLLGCSTNTETNYRFYSEEDIKRLEQILLFKSLGFSLDEIKIILASSDNQSVDKLFNEKLVDIETKVSQLIRCKEVLMAINNIYRKSKLGYLDNHHIIKELSYMNNVFVKMFSKLDSVLQAKVISELYYTGTLSNETIKNIATEPGFRILNELHMMLIKSIFNKLDRDVEKRLMEEIEKTDFNLSEEIKGAMFTFEDVIILSDKIIEKWLDKCDDRDLVIALKESSIYVRTRIFTNLSRKRLDLIRDKFNELTEYSLDESYIAMKNLVHILQQMDFSGEIDINQAQVNCG